MDRTSAPGSVGGMYVDYDPVNEIQGTLLHAEDRNAIQEELLAVIEEAGLTPSMANLHQLLDALKSGVDGVVNAARLGGQLPAYYRDASNLNAGEIAQARLNASTLLTLIKTVDGVGSGLAADFSAYFESVAVSSGGRKTEAAPSGGATYDNLDVTGINVLLLDARLGTMTINGFSGGVTGQILYVFKGFTSGDIYFNHANPSGEQPFYTPQASRLCLTNNRYGGVVMVCNAGQWRPITPGSIDADPGTAVYRDINGRIKAAAPTADDDVDTRGARNAAIASTYIQATAGDFIVRENNTTRSKTLSDTGTNTYEKLKEMGVDKTGTLRIKFSARAKGMVSDHNGTAYFRIYKNGAAVGTERSITFTTSSWVSNSWTEDLSFTEGDLVQIYARGFTSTGESGTLEITAFSVCAGNYGINPTA